MSDPWRRGSQISAGGRRCDRPGNTSFQRRSCNHGIIFSSARCERNLAQREECRRQQFRFRKNPMRYLAALAACRREAGASVDNTQEEHAITSLVLPKILLVLQRLPYKRSPMLPPLPSQHQCVPIHSSAIGPCLISAYQTHDYKKHTPDMSEMRIQT